MYLLPLLTLLGTALCVPFSVDVSSTTRDDRAERYLLPTHVIPTFYDVILHINPDSPESFNGEVSIRVLPLNSTNEIVVHALGMTIGVDAITVYPDVDPNENLFSSFTLATDDTEFLRIQLTRELIVFQPVIVNIRYTSLYATNMFGIYVSTYQEGSNTVSLVTSQLQPTFARRAFPCFDEPALKAIFRITIYAPPTHPVVKTNMPIRTDLHKPVITGWNKFEFEDTPIMSTYLHGFLVSNFGSVTNAANPIYRKPMSIYSRPGTQNTASFAMDFAQNSMNALETLYDFPYYPPKLDKAGVPDFAAGAMENWGLVIYREVALLVSDELTTTATRQNVARLITHENVHLWLGNEVSPISWTYLWLNEGFATFYEHFACDLVFPGYRMEDQLLLSVQNVFQADAVLSVNPMTFPVYTPSEVLGTFNSVAYQKSGSVIRMLRHFLTPDVFDLGMSYYIKAMSRKAAAPADLYAHLQRALTESSHYIPYSIESIMNLWTLQGGFPVLTVTRSAASANSVVVSQVRFLTDTSSTSGNRWHVPINWVLSTDPNFSDTKPMDWIPTAFPARAVTIDGLAEADWYIFNKQQTGYYRVNYDEANWIALIDALGTNHEVIHRNNRANLLDDAFNLARNGRLSYNHALNLSLYLVDEKDYIPWAAVNPAFTYLEVALSESESYPAFQHYIRNLTESLYDELGFDVVSGEEHVAAFHRNIILDLNCRHGNEDCIDNAATLLQNFITDQNQRPRPDLQTVVYCSALRGGSVENFNHLWNMYLISTDSSEQSILLNALGCTSNPERRQFYLNQVTAENSEVREQDRHTIVVSVINSSPESMNVALDFVHENFHLIQPRVQGLTGTTNILNAFARRLNSEAHSEKINAFARIHAPIFTAGELAAIAGIKENIAASITWTNEYAATVEAWLEERYGDGNSAAVLTSSLIVLLSVVVAIFNH